MAYLWKGGIEGRIVSRVKLGVSCCSSGRGLAEGRHRRLLCIEEPVPWKITPTAGLQVLQRLCIHVHPHSAAFARNKCDGAEWVLVQSDGQKGVASSSCDGR
jgi:hypothetical protein